MTAHEKTVMEQANEWYMKMQEDGGKNCENYAMILASMIPYLLAEARRLEKIAIEERAIRLCYDSYPADMWSNFSEMIRNKFREQAARELESERQEAFSVVL